MAHSPSPGSLAPDANQRAWLDTVAGWFGQVERRASQGIGTILFFEDQDVITTLEEKYPRYAENFKLWSEQSHGIALDATWLALAERGIGMSVQHYNPLVDVQVAEKYALPQSWRLRAQAPFGSIEAPAGEKEFMDRGGALQGVRGLIPYPFSRRSGFLLCQLARQTCLYGMGICYPVGSWLVFNPLFVNAC